MITATNRLGETSHQDPLLPLSAGPMALYFTGGDLRYLRLGECEVVRRIYGVVRDRWWGNVPGFYSCLDVSSQSSSFRINYLCEHRENGIHFVWKAEISGAEDGTIIFQFDGEAKSTFLRNRIGLCVLHPIRECAGARCRTTYVNGTDKELVFPQEVAANQPIPEFTDLAGLHHEIQPGVWLEVTFDGDVFETEDQRNWIDASFKTYSTPLRLPFPVEVKAGTRIKQAVTVRLRHEGSAHRTLQTVHMPRSLARVCCTSAERLPVPRIGLGIASHGKPPSKNAVGRLSCLGLSHLRVDLRMADARWPDRLRAAASEASKLGTSLELAIHLPRTEPGDLSKVAHEIGCLQAEIARALVLREGQRSTLPGDLETGKSLLGSIPVGVGTDADLYQLHLQPPPKGGDFLSWSMNPQVHASDELSIAETPEAVVHQLATMRRRHPGRFLVVSPITLKPRFNPVAANEGISLQEQSLPPADARQASLFAAAWTLAMLKALAEGGAGSVTLFETTGPRGIVENLDGTQPDSGPEGVFPVYHVLRDIAEFGVGKVIPTETGKSPGPASLFLESGNRRRLIVANLSAETLCVRLEESHGIAFLRLLDASTRREAMEQPEAFRVRQSRFTSRELALTAHAVATLDFTET